MRRFWILLTALIFSATGLFAQSDSLSAQHIQLRLVMPDTTIVPGHGTTAGLYIKLDPGWHVYWQNAGDAGEPPSIEWTLPAGITAGPMQFPAPKRLPLGPLMDFGYEDEVLFPQTLAVGTDLKPGTATLHAHVTWQVCREACIPGKGDLTLTRPVAQAGGAVATSADAALLEKFIERLPHPLPSDGSAVFSPTAQGFRLYIETGRSEHEAAFFPSDQYTLDNPAPQTATPTDRGIILDLKKDSTLTANPTTLKGVVVLDNARSFEIAANAGQIPAAIPGGKASGGAIEKSSLLRNIALAFLGGLILNLMPCVFPVLFLKGLSLVQSGNEERHKLRTHGLVYAAGILFSFWAIVGVLLGLRHGGAVLGWGFQFQSPAFLSLMAALLFFLGLSLAGMFDIGLTLTSAGGSLAAKQGYAGSFFTGVLAVVVATPCTAPFMGIAIGYALAQPAPITFAIFTALALGLAAPYLLLTLQPAWTRILPRPGAWMEILKQATAVPVFLTVIWLLWVLAGTYGANVLAFVLGGFVLLAIAGWVAGRWPARRVPFFFALLLLIAGLYVCFYGAVAFAIRAETAQAGSGSKSTAPSNGWEPWSEEAVAKYRTAGRPVFVDFTASWCLSCQVNERAVLRREDVQAAFRQKNTALLRADWTEHDERITKALTALGRSGVPAYVVYAPGSGTSASDVQLLPEVLTTGIVFDALNKVTH